MVPGMPAAPAIFRTEGLTKTFDTGTVAVAAERG
jgi:hypothetical protein